MPTSMAPSTTIAIPTSHGWRPVMRAEGIAQQEQHHDRDRIGHAQRQSDFVHEDERDRHWKSGEEHEDENAEPTQPLVLAQAGALRRRRQLHQPLTYRFQFRGLQDRGDQRRQRVGDVALRLLRIGGLCAPPGR